MDKINKLWYGLDKVHYAMFSPGAFTWDTPKRIIGAVGFTPTPQGSETTLYADNGKYFFYTKDNGDQGDLEMYLFPDYFLIDILGWAKDKNGALLALANKAQLPFALMFEVNVVDENDRVIPMRMIYYNVKGAKPTIQYNTSEDAIAPNTQTMTITATPINFEGIGGLTSIQIRQDTMPDEFETFFDEVYIPDELEAEEPEEPEEPGEPPDPPEPPEEL